MQKYRTENFRQIIFGQNNFGRFWPNFWTNFGRYCLRKKIQQGRKREPQKLSSLSSFCSHKISFYSDKYLNGSSSRISLLSIASMIEAFLKANLIISPEFRNLWYRLISHVTRIGFISDNLVSISIWWTFFPLFRTFITSFKILLRYLLPRFQK